MKHLFTIFIPGLLLLNIPPVYTQDLLLTHGKKMRTIEQGTFIQVEVPKPSDGPCKDCPLNLITGKLIEVKSDSLTIRVVESSEYILNQEKVVGYTYRKYTSPGDGPLINIPKSDVLSVVLKGKNKAHQMHPWDVAGNVLTNLGLVTAFFVFMDNNRSEEVLYATSFAMITGSILSLLVRQPYYKTSTQSGTKKLSHEIWKLN